MVQEHGNHHLQQQQQQQQQMAKYSGGGNAAAGTGVARASRKNKPKKIPQRGLGVAQLEKLRIEEQKKMGGGGAPVPVLSTATPSSHALNGGGLCHLPPPPPPPPLPLSALSRPAADGGVHCGFPPVLWNPVDPTKHPYKRSMCPQPPLPLVSTGLSLTASSSHSAMEPPSNQMYSSYGSRSSVAATAPPPAEEEREMAGVDRSWPFMFEGMSTAASTFRTTSKAPPPPPPLAPFTVRATASQSGLADVSPDLSRFEFRATNYFSSPVHDVHASAYANPSGWTSDLASCKPSSSSRENGRGRDAAFLTLSSQPAHLIRQAHVVPSIHLPEFSDFSAMPSQQGSVSGSSSSSPPPKPFYSFLPVGPVRCERAPGECKTDVSESGVDLELKLWKG